MKDWRSLRPDRASAGPAYVQIADGIRQRVLDGSLRAGDQLPTIRELAEQIGVTPVTVHRAYGRLRALGFVDATTGRGTFVLHPSHATGSISLATAEPAPDLHPVESFVGAREAVGRGCGSLLQYAPATGDPMLRQQIATLLSERGIVVPPDDVLITAGCTQGLTLLLQALAVPGDRVLVEQPTSLGFLTLLRALGLHPVAVPMDKEGPKPAALQSLALSERARLFYTMPTFHNPRGTSMGVRRRSALLSLAENLGLLLIEDDTFHLLHHDSPPPRPLKAMDKAGVVAYLDSFSKTVMPGLRLGSLIPPPRLRDRLAHLLEATTLGGCQLFQRALAELLDSGRFARHVEQVRPVYRERRDAIVRALEDHMPEDVRWSRPSGGLCLWVTLPPGAGSVDALCDEAAEEGVLCTPGSSFLFGEREPSHLRLCYGRETPERLTLGVRKLAELVRRRAERRRGETGAIPAPLV